MMQPIGTPTVPVILAHEWKKGMVVPKETIVAHKGYFYFNKSGKDSEGNPATDEDYSKALSGAGVVKYLIEYYI